MAGDIDEWLEALDLIKYRDAFAANEIAFGDLSDLTEDDLKEMGLPIGPRRRALKAIAEQDAQRAMPTGAASPERAKPSQLSPVAERRQLTIMFCDLVGSTALSRRLDPEDHRDIMRQYQDAVAGAVSRYGGYVAKYLGDGVLIYFGWPQAYEDQAERAVRAGLDTVAAVNDVKVTDEYTLAARVGIATGQVVVGDLVGESGRDAEAVSGETPNLAARLQDVAEPGQVVIGDETRRLIGQTFAIDDLGNHDLKGFDAAVQAWGVAGEVVAGSRFEAAHGASLTRLIGRETELQLLVDRWHLARGGEGQTVLISGEAGIGKSRLMQGLRGQVAGSDHIRMRYQCSSFHTNSALYPTVQHLERLAGFAPDDDGEDKLDKLEKLLRQGGDDIQADVPLFATLLSLPFEGRYGALTQPPQQIKERLLEALVDRLIRLAERNPVLFLFEDAHWIDPSSQELLALTIGRLHQARVLLIITHRPEWSSPFSGHNHVTSLQLNRLGRSQGAEIVNAVAGEDVSDDVVEHIVSRTDGVPLFIEELTKSLVEGALDVAETDIPVTLQASLLARLDRLGAEAKETAQLGAVIGREFPHNLLASVSEKSAEELDTILDRLSQSELVFRTGTPPDVKYIFKHALIQDAAYDSLLRGRRQSLHGSIAKALERDFATTAKLQPQVLAHHFSNAGMAEKAIAYWLEASNQEARTSANAEALGNLKKGLVELDALPEGVDRDDRELDLQIGLINPLIAVRGYSAPETKAASERAIELCRQIGRTTRIFPALYGQWVNNYVRGNIAQTTKLATDYLELANTQQEIVPRLVGHRITGTSYLVHGSPTAASQHLEQAWALHDATRDAASAFSYGQDIGVSALCYLSWASCLGGYPHRANAGGQEAILRARAVEHALTLTLSFQLVAMTAFLLRDRQTLERHTAELQLLADEHDLPQFQDVGLVLQGAVLRSRGRPREGLEKVELGIERLARTQAKLYQPFYLLIRVELLKDLGRAEDALEFIAEGINIISETQEHWTEPEVHRVRGELYASLSQLGEAEAAFKAALATARDQAAKWWELRTAVSLARLWQDQGKTVEARNLLAPIYDWFTEGFDTPDLIEAKLLLDELF